MKKHTIIIFLLFPLLTFCQIHPSSVKNYQEVDYKPVHFGFSLGTNISDFTFIRNENVYSDSFLFADLNKPLYTIGFDVNIISEFRLNEYFALRFTPGLILTANRPVEFYSNYPGIPVKEKKPVITTKIESNYLDFPVHIKFNSKRINNYRPYLIGGISTRYDLVARKNYEENSLIKLCKSPPIDVFYDIGFGVDFYLLYFKFSTELKLSSGMTNVLHMDPPDEESGKYLNTLKGLRSHLLILSFNFE